MAGQWQESGAGSDKGGGDGAAAGMAAAAVQAGAGPDDRGTVGRGPSHGRQAGLGAAARQWLQRQPQLPLPGHGQTLQRWRALAAIAASDLCLAKVLEAHYDAQAILAELQAPALADGELAAVWAAGGPQATLCLDPDGNHASGDKPWCSGAGLVDVALVTAQAAQGPQLLRIALDQAGISRHDDGWHATGMGGIRSGRVSFQRVHCEPVGAPGAYLQRPGFWHGGAGIAACWFGAAVALALPLLRSPRIATDPLAAALLGQVDMALAASAALLRELAAAIDARPADPQRLAVVRVRSQVERGCQLVLDAVGRALGPAPMCLDAAHARRWSDLAVFMRQSHADHDWAELGRGLAPLESPWAL